MQTLQIGIIGLGLIGGSLAKAIKKFTPHTVYGLNRSKGTEQKALACGAMDGVLTDEALSGCDILFVGLYPALTIKTVLEKLPLLKKGCVIADLCGIKREVCGALSEPCRVAGVTFIGAHPMAGREFSGFDYTTADLFQRASLILTPTEGTEQEERAVRLLDGLALAVGFRAVVVTTPENHDRMIAYTSQLAHVLSNAYVKSPCAKEHTGYSAGSFKDLTRVAYLNEEMWTELFMQNRDNLTQELSLLIDNLTAYKQAMEAGDADTLKALLREGREIKEQLQP
ncbi:prephenate dehydrogenase [Acetanaerobacterium elongatum]|uniref:Prephenate dehydrogenase n=1 Tax=Acetanaerobacterium elongatum TaxID=258515 RepID=A0A1G9UKS8_9FIRM|nr:prephenate dehydrogenase/arogenate dehydrogenase family protein [Acetanaerobacterium elongatum]SDM60529.1 prephenate dehydrogenase [Acetanaerobacterium elongatum]